MSYPHLYQELQAGNEKAIKHMVDWLIDCVEANDLYSWRAYFVRCPKNVQQSIVDSIPDEGLSLWLSMTYQLQSAYTKNGHVFTYIGREHDPRPVIIPV